MEGAGQPSPLSRECPPPAPPPPPLTPPRPPAAAAGTTASSLHLSHPAGKGAVGRLETGTPAGVSPGGGRLVPEDTLPPSTSSPAPRQELGHRRPFFAHHHVWGGGLLLLLSGRKGRVARLSVVIPTTRATRILTLRHNILNESAIAATHSVAESPSSGGSGILEKDRGEFLLMWENLCVCNILMSRLRLLGVLSCRPGYRYPRHHWTGQHQANAGLAYLPTHTHRAFICDKLF